MNTRDKLIRLAQIILAAIGGILTIADKVTALPLPPGWTKYWGLVVAAAVAVKPTVQLIGDLLDDGQINGSFPGPANTIPPNTQPPSATNPQILRP
jgi:hypothetical protein